MHNQGTSLQPRVMNGAAVTVQKDDCGYAPKRGDLVLFDTPASVIPLPKIVILYRGDAFAIDNSELLINRKPAKNSVGLPYRFATNRTLLLQLDARDYNGRVPEPMLLVLGDNTAGTLDSRPQAKR